MTVNGRYLRSVGERIRDILRFLLNSGPTAEPIKIPVRNSENK